MDPGVIGALSAVLGSVVGGSATIVTAWVTQRTQGRRTLIRAEIRKREQLYAEFIGECSKAAIDALDHTLDDPAKLFQVYALENRIRLVSSDEVVAAADRAIKVIVRQYFTPNLGPEAMREMALKSFAEDVKRDDPLRPFSEACRKELKELQLAA
jgi:hypothetical protein